MAFFVVAVEDATPAQANSITEYLGTLGGYWHWMSHLWLLNSYSDLNAIEIRDALNVKAGGPVCIVLKVDLAGSDSWAGLFPSARLNEWADWLLRLWRPGI